VPSPSKKRKRRSTTPKKRTEQTPDKTVGSDSDDAWTPGGTEEDDSEEIERKRKKKKVSTRPKEKEGSIPKHIIFHGSTKKEFHKMKQSCIQSCNKINELCHGRQGVLHHHVSTENLTQSIKQYWNPAGCKVIEESEVVLIQDPEDERNKEKDVKETMVRRMADMSDPDLRFLVTTTAKVADYLGGNGDAHD